MKRVIDGWTRLERIPILTPLTIFILQYRIEEDWFSYCRQKTSEADITGAVPNFPVSYLHETVRDLARKVVLPPADFPRDQLRLLQQGAVPTDHDQISTGRSLLTLTPPIGSPPDFKSVPVDIDTDRNDDDDDTTSDPLRVKTWHTFVHPTIGELTKNLRAKNKPLRLTKGLKKAGIMLKDLPKLKCKDRADPPREGLCIKFTLGCCEMGEGCNFCHIAGDQLPDSYVKKLTPHLTNLVKNGLEKLDGPKKFSGTKRKRASGPNTVDLQE